MHRRLALLLLALAALLLLQGQDIYRPPRPSAAACTAASYAALPAGQPDGTLCEVTGDGTSWRYDDTTALWLPPDVNPSSLILDYDGSAVPAGAGWTEVKTGTCTSASDGNELTLDDKADGQIMYCYQDAANLTAAKNVLMLFRAKVTAQEASANLQKVIFGQSLDTSGYTACASLAYGTATSAADNFMSGPCGSAQPAYAVGNSPDNAVYRTYYMIRRATPQTITFGVLGDRVPIWSLGSPGQIGSDVVGTAFRSPCNIANAIAFGGQGVAARTATSVWDWVKVANF